MRWIEVKVLFKEPFHAVDTPGLAFTERVVDVFYRFGIIGVVIEDPDEPVPGDEDTPDFKRPESHSVGGYFPDALETVRRFEKVVHEVAGREGIRVRVQSRPVDEEDWSESWKAFFHPQRIGRRLVVKPSWRDFDAGTDDLILEIDPGMAFGTGTHPTTAMCLETLEELVEPGCRLLDVGCGSGILMIAAARLGAGLVAGLDRDPVAVGITRENLIRNGIGPDRFRLHCGHLLEAIDSRFDMVVANILAEVVVDLMDTIGRVLRPGGWFVGSGIIVERREAVLERLEAKGFGSPQIRTDGQWMAVAARFGAAEKPNG
ncbi:MAG: 50S ribosomal protein L11 methyltransferase [Desulfobacterales bacterium]